MTTEQKQQIVDAANYYLQEKGLSQGEASRLTGINAGYLSNMLRGNFFTTVNNKQVDIADKWFFNLADFIGFSIKKKYWDTINTPQFMQIVADLKTAKDEGLTRMLIGPTGCGKTYAIDKFCKKYPIHTYRITISSLYKLSDIVNELIDKLSIDMSQMRANAATYSIKTRMDKVVEKMTEIKRQGGYPILIIDEGENMEMALLKMIKGLYDQIKDHCGIVLVGTERLVDRMLNRRGQTRGRNREALPELYRRFKAGHKNIPPIDHRFSLFLEKYVEDKGLRKLLCELCGNYGELNDYLEPAIREADELKQPLTENFFRLKYNMPKTGSYVN